MSGFLDILRFANESLMSPQELSARNDFKITAGLVKLASLIAGIASIFFFAATPTLYAFCFWGSIAIFSHDMFRMSENTIGVLNNPVTEGIARLHPDNAIGHLSKNTLILGWVLREIRNINGNN